MRNLKGIGLLGFIFFALSFKAQTNSVQNYKKTQTQSVSEPVVINNSSQTATNTSNLQIDENDEYQGRTQEFLNLLTVKELPSDFPKYNKSYGTRGYNKLLDNFLATHKDIITESVRKKLESQGK
jgi:lipopolysaccharide export LptBFGC system permease protein LptF